MSESEEIAIPQMIGLDLLTKILLAYLKAGGDRETKSALEVAQISGVAQNNVSLNNKFFTSVGLLEGVRGSYKLTEAGIKYARALDWGRLDESKKILAETLKDRPLVARTLSYVDLNRPVTKDDLIGKIASLAGVPNEPRFGVGIRGFIEMLTLSGLLAQDKEGKVTTGRKEIEEEPKTTPPVSAKEMISKTPISFPVSIAINVDEKSDPERIKTLLRAIREALSEN